jgi:hypothetical protein
MDWSGLAEITRSLTVVAGLTAVAPFAAADTLLDARIAMGLGDFKRALEILEPMAKAGDDEAQFHIGLMYSSGEGVPRDARTAVEWYRQAAEKGNADAQYNLGQEYSLYEPVNGVDPFPEDYAEAYFWFSLAASNYAARGKGNIDGSREMRDVTARKLSEDQRIAVDARVKAWEETH